MVYLDCKLGLAWNKLITYEMQGGAREEQRTRPLFSQNLETISQKYVEFLQPALK